MDESQDSKFPIPTRKGPIGLTTLYEAPGKATVDMILVHGLNGNSITTWTKDGVCWPFDILPKDFPDSRIMTWGYTGQSSTTAKQQNVSVRSTLSRLGVDLLTGVEMIRMASSSTERPIMFICHSLGGLVVKQMLLESSLRPSPRSKSILQCTVGLVLFGTPNLPNTKFSSYLKILRLVGVKANTALTEAFMMQDGVAEVNENANKVITDAKIPIISYFETLPTKSVGLIVPRESTVIGPPTEQVIALDATHAEMVKLSHPSDPGYQKVLHSIQQTLKHSVTKPRPSRQAPISQSTLMGQRLGKKEAARELKALKATLRDVESKLNPYPDTHRHAHLLQTEIGCFKEVIGSVQKRGLFTGRHAVLERSTLDLITGLTGRLQRFSGDEELWNRRVDENENDTTDDTARRALEDMATEISHTLTIVNTMLLLKADRRSSWGISRESKPYCLLDGFLFSTVRYSDRRRFQFDALSINGGPRPAMQRSLSQNVNPSTWVSKFLACRNILEDGKDTVYDKVKIAVLDSGLAPEHRHLVSDYIDFTGPQPTQQPTDLTGHGTFVTDLLKQAIPSAEIYSVRVMTGTEDEDDNSVSIAKGLRHALEPWNVDIISMSFASEKPAKNITEAIELCIKDQILLFAAACNSGAQGTPTIGYPASHLGGVFCIHSSDELGNASKFTPPAKDNSDNFSTIGENLVAAWPSSLMQKWPETYDASFLGSEESEDEGVDLDSDEEDRDERQEDGQEAIAELSGTSMATPIAAGIAAMVIEFCRQYRHLLSDSDADEIETHRGMHAVLKFMSDGNRQLGYDWIKPWQLFPEGWDPQRIAVVISYALLQS